MITGLTGWWFQRVPCESHPPSIKHLLNGPNTCKSPTKPSFLGGIWYSGISFFLQHHDPQSPTAPCTMFQGEWDHQSTKVLQSLNPQSHLFARLHRPNSNDWVWVNDLLQFRSGPQCLNSWHPFLLTNHPMFGNRWLTQMTRGPCRPWPAQRMGHLKFSFIDQFLGTWHVRHLVLRQCRHLWRCRDDVLPHTFWIRLWSDSI